MASALSRLSTATLLAIAQQKQQHDAQRGAAPPPHRQKKKRRASNASSNNGEEGVFESVSFLLEEVDSVGAAARGEDQLPLEVANGSADATPRLKPVAPPARSFADVARSALASVEDEDLAEGLRSWMVTAAGDESDKPPTAVSTASTTTKKEPQTNNNNNTTTKKKKKKTVKSGANYETAVQTPSSAVADASQLDMSAWLGLGLHERVIDALAALGFTEPTPIQLQCVPLATLQRRDVVGAAETGSGKTLSFGLPIISNIVSEREVRQARPSAAERVDKLEALVLVPTRELAVQVASHLRAIAQPCGVEIAVIVGGMSVQKQQRLLKRRPPIVVATPGRFWQLIDDNGGSFDPYLSDLTGLRYFALDEADRMVEKAHFDDLHLILAKFPIFKEVKSKKRQEEEAAAAAEKAAADAAAKLAKQRRKMAPRKRRKSDEDDDEERIVLEDEVADEDGSADDDDDDADDELDEDGDGPMRIESLEDLDNDDGLTVTVEEHGDDGRDEPVQGPPPVIDEPELGDARPTSTRRRQTFVFSATLGAAVADALASSSHLRALRQKRGLAPAPTHQSSGNELVDAVAAENDVRTAQLLGALEFQGGKAPAVVDLTSARLTVQQLREYRVECTLEAKDVYLYAFLDEHRGRTLVFVNAISAIRRLLPLLELLKVPVWSLHAQKQQRQRLKVLDRFRAAEFGVLIATDVAARGLDIPNVDHVVHFQVPRTIELYVHRTGRTARAQRAGISLMLVSPEDRDNFTKLLRLPGKSSRAFEPMLFDPVKMVVVEKRVVVARELEVAQHQRFKATLKKREQQMSAAVAESGLGDDSDDDGAEAMARAAQRRYLTAQLKQAEHEQRTGEPAPAPATAASRRQKRKAQRARAHSGVTTDAKGELVKLSKDSFQVKLPQLRGQLDELMQTPVQKRRRGGFLPIDGTALLHMTGSRPDALKTPQDHRLAVLAHPTASFAEKAWASKPFFKTERDQAAIERRNARRLGKQRAVAERKAAKKAKYEAFKTKRHGGAPGDDESSDGDSL